MLAARAASSSARRVSAAPRHIALRPSATFSATATVSQIARTRSAAAVVSGIRHHGAQALAPGVEEAGLVAAAQARGEPARDRLPVRPAAVAGRQRRALEQQVRPREIAAGRRGAQDGAVARAAGQRVEQVLDAVARRQAGDQVGPLERHGGLVGQRPHELLVALAEAARRAREHAQQAQLLTRGLERRGQEGRVLEPRPQAAAGAAPASAREQLEQQRPAVRARLARVRRIGGDEPQLAPVGLEPEQLAEVGGEHGPGAHRRRLVDPLVLRRGGQPPRDLREPRERPHALARLRVELRVLDRAADERRGVREQRDVVLRELARRRRVEHDHPDHLPGTVGHGHGRHRLPALLLELREVLHARVTQRAARDQRRLLAAAPPSP